MKYICYSEVHPTLGEAKVPLSELALVCVPHSHMQVYSTNECKSCP